MTKFPGISLATVRGVYEDQKALTKEKTALIKAAKIREVAKKQAISLKPGPQPVQKEEAAAQVKSGGTQDPDSGCRSTPISS